MRVVSAGEGRSGLGWLLLLVILAVPAFLFYGWWSRLRADHNRLAAARAQRRGPSGRIFEAPPRPRLGFAAAAPVRRLLSVPAAASTSASAVKPASRPSFPTEPPVADASRASKPLAVPTASVSPAAVKPRASPAAALPPLALSRDPMLSPSDVARLREQALAKARPRRAKAVRRPSASSIEKEVKLQGIVARPGGQILAIVNDEVVGAGQSVKAGKRGRRVKILRVSVSAVTFQYEGYRFTRHVKQ